MNTILITQKIGNNALKLPIILAAAVVSSEVRFSTSESSSWLHFLTEYENSIPCQSPCHPHVCDVIPRACCKIVRRIYELHIPLELRGNPKLNPL